MTAGDEKGTGERTADEYVHSSYTSFRHFKHKFDFIRISVITQHCHERTMNPLWHRALGAGVVALLLACCARQPSPRPALHPAAEPPAAASPASPTLTIADEETVHPAKLPESKEELYRLGRAYQVAARYGDAALVYEAMANRFAQDADIPTAPPHADLANIATALVKAALWRRGLGDIPRYLRDVDAYRGLYADRPEFAAPTAALFDDISSLLDEPDEPGDPASRRRYSLERLLKVKPADLRIVATLQLAALTWQAACPIPGENGACIALHRRRPEPPLVRRIRVAFERGLRWPGNICKRRAKYPACGGPS